MATIKEIAAALGVSATTVSNVVNGHTEKMSEETRSRVEEALMASHYELNVKKNTGTAENRTVAAIFCMGHMKNVLMDPFCGELLGAMEEELKSFNRYLTYYVPDTANEKQLKRLLTPWNVDGAVLLGYEPENCAALQEKVNKPLVFIDSYSLDDEPDYDNIGLQDFEGAYEMASYLIRQGHRSIAFFCDQNPPRASNGARFKGFRRALSEHGIHFHEEDFYYLPQNRNMRHETLRQFARKRGRNYTAAFFVSDFYANEGVNAFFTQGLHVPDDISVAGFDDNIYARLCRPSLTTVRQSPSEKGRQAVKLLMRRVRGEEIPQRMMRLPTELIVRESVRNAGGR